MDQESVTAALRVTPEVEGDLRWDGPDTVHFRPKTLAVNTRYRVSLGDPARSREGLSLSTALDFAFTTLGPLYVTRVSPEAGTTDLRLDAPVLIVFNRPVVPLNCTGQEAGKSPACPELPITLTPSTIGKGTWVHTSLYRYESALGGWAAGQTYEVNLGTGFVSLEGATLSEPFDWTFSTALPFIQEIIPPKGAQNVLLERAVRVVFNTPMDRENTAAAFSLVDEQGETVPGSITWEDHGSTLVFTPTRPLALGTRYTAQVADRARALTSAPLQNPSQWSFMTVPLPTLLSTFPEDGAENVSPQEPVRLTFAGAIDAQSLEKHVTVTPTVQAPYTYWDKTSGVLTLSWDKKARTVYCVRVGAGIKDIYGNTMVLGSEAAPESDATEFCFETGDLPPFFAPASTLETFTLDAAEPARLYFLNRNIGRMSFMLSQLEDWESQAALAFLQARETQGGVPVREWQVTFDGDPNVSEVTPVDLTRRGGPLPTGLYRLSWEQSAATWWRQEVGIAVVDRHVMVKLTDEEALVWVTDLRSAEPVTRTEVRVVDVEGLLIAAGTTDDEGLARIPISPRENLWDVVAAVVGEPGAPGFGIASTQWNAGISPWDFDIPATYGPRTSYHVYMHTDRSIYRPGQRVNFRGIVRMDKDARYLLPVVKDVSVAVRDAMGSVVYSTTLRLSQMGTFDGHYLLPEDAPIGEYMLEISMVGEEVVEQHAFAVAAYRKPEFALTVIAAQDDLLDGEMLRVLAEGNYYFGGPVVNAALKWTIRASPYHGMGDRWAFSRSLAQDWPLGYGGAGFNIAEGEAKTDAQGQFLLEIPAELELLDAENEAKAESASDVKTSARWVVEFTLTDASGFSVSAREPVRVHAARFYMSVTPRQWVAVPGEAVEVDVAALDWDALPVGAQDVAVQLAQRTWYRVFPRRAYEGPTWAYTDTVVGPPVTIETDAQGDAVATVTPPDSGMYVVIAEAEDEEGNPVRAEGSLWVGGPGTPQWRMPESKIEPVADLSTYQVGDTAKILVPTPFTGTYQVLMTVERGGILDVQRFTFDEPNPLVELSIKETYLPNVYVSFVVIRGVDEASPASLGSPSADVRMGMVRLNVNPEVQALRVVVIPDRETAYGPGDTVNLTVRTLDAAGEPVQAEVGLAVVDKAVLALAREIRDATSMMESFYGGRPLRVITGDSLLMLFNRVSSDLERLEKDAERLVAEMSLGGIGGGGGMGAPTEVRQEFPDTAFWEAHVETGPSGEAQVSFKLPDSLTTWVVDARAVTADTQVGQTTTELVVSQPLLVRPVTPRFLVAGDHVEIAAIVHNNTAEALDVTVQLEVEGASLEGGDVAQTVSVAAMGMARVTWPIVVSDVGQAVCLTFAASGGGYQDATGPTVGLDNADGCDAGALPVYRFDSTGVVGTAGILEEAGRRLEAVWLPEEAGGGSHVTIRLDPSLASVVVDGVRALDLGDLVAPAPMSTDMLVSRFLPNLYTYRVLRTLELEQVASEDQLQTLIADALDRLYARQNEAGGWGWWRREDTSMYLTAYVTLGILEAQRAGFTVREDNLRRALDYLAAALNQSLNSGARAASQPFTLFVLSESDYRWSDQVATVLYNDRHRLSVTARAYLALALGKMDASDPRVTTLLGGLNADVEVTATGAHWADADSRYWATDILATTAVLETLMRFDPQNPLLSQGVRWLIMAREGRGWPTAYETAWSLIVLTDYMLLIDDLAPGYTWSLALNGVPLGEEEPSATGGTFEFWRVEQGDNPVLREGINVLEVARTAGSGHLYYATHAALALPVDDVTAESRGVVVQRAYCAVTGNHPRGFARPLQSDVMRGSLPPCAPVSQVNVGDLVEVRLTLVLPRNRYFLTLQDVYPAGMEPVDPSLSTESQGLWGPEARVDDSAGGWWWDPFEHRELRDERAMFFASEIPAGTYQVTYLLRAAMPGIYNVLPATASETYFPEVWGRSAGASFQVVP
jgi:hypothetical protein